MRRILTMCGAAALVTAMLLMNNPLSASADDESDHGRRTIHLVQPYDQETFETVDAAAAGPSAGDQLMGTAKEFDGHGKQVGTVGFMCTAITPAGTDGPVICHASWTFAQGQIETTYQLANTSGQTITLAIVGGTGQFQGASGQIVETFGADHANDTISLR